MQPSNQIFAGRLTPDRSYRPRFASKYLNQEEKNHVDTAISSHVIAFRNETCMHFLWTIQELTAPNEGIGDVRSDRQFHTPRVLGPAFWIFGVIFSKLNPGSACMVVWGASKDVCKSDYIFICGGSKSTTSGRSQQCAQVLCFF